MKVSLFTLKSTFSSKRAQETPKTDPFEQSRREGPRKFWRYLRMTLFGASAEPFQLRGPEVFAPVAPLLNGPACGSQSDRFRNWNRSRRVSKCWKSYTLVTKSLTNSKWCELARKLLNMTISRFFLYLCTRA